MTDAFTMSFAAEVANRDAAIEAQEYNLVSLLKPRIFIDGYKWCVLYGDNLQDGVAGFGDTPYLAILDFNKQWHVSAGEENFG